jgi:outer membrane lipoprotein-sorting protein
MNADEERFARMIERSHLDDAPRPEHRDDLRNQVLAAFDRAQAPSAWTIPFARFSDHWRSIMTRPVPRLAAAVLLAGLLITAGWLVFGVDTQVAFADMIKPILEAKSAKFKMTVQMKGRPSQTIRGMVLEPGRIRQEMPDGGVWIMNPQAGKWVQLDAKGKRAYVMELANVPEKEVQGNYFGWLRAMLLESQEKTNVKREALGEKEIDGHRAVGYRVTGPAHVITIWGDRKTGLPIQIEWSTEMMPESKLLMSDFVFDVALDESLFSVEVPADYEVRSASMDFSEPQEKDLVDALRRWSDLADGTFPDSPVPNMQTVVGLLMKKLGLDQGQEPTEEQFRQAMQFSTAIGRGFGFALKQPPEADAHYAGKGVKRDTPEVPIFWYRPKDAKTYRIIYADLSVVEADTPPSVPDAQPISAKAAPKQ